VAGSVAGHSTQRRRYAVTLPDGDTASRSAMKETSQLLLPHVLAPRTFHPQHLLSVPVSSSPLSQSPTDKSALKPLPAYFSSLMPQLLSPYLLFITASYLFKSPTGGRFVRPVQQCPVFVISSFGPRAECLTPPHLSPLSVSLSQFRCFFSDL
jgi:hypothetical protein